MPNYRRIIDAYRSKLLEVDPAACNEVDDQMYAEGEKWVADQREIDWDNPMTAEELADRFGLSKHDLQNWSQRYRDELPVIGKRGNRNLYMPRDVLRVCNRVRNH